MTQRVSSSNEKFDFVNIFTGISLPAALFVERSLFIAFIFSVVPLSLNEKLPLTFYRYLILTILGRFLNLQTMFLISSSLLQTGNQ